MIEESLATPAERLRLFVRVGVFVVLVLAGRFVFPIVLAPFGDPLVTSALSTFAAAACANAIVARGWESGKVSDFGMGWTNVSGRQLITGIAAGASAAVLIALIAVLFQLASFTRADAGSHFATLPLLAAVLAFGAVGEELMFHGYAFQHLVRVMGEFATVLPVAVLFGLAHAANANVTVLGIFNTIVWGVLLGYAYLRTRALWLPIGLHFGWNLALPLLGGNLSGFTMGLTGYQLSWRTGALLSGGNYGVEGGLFTTIVVILLFVALPRLSPERVDRG